jgi:hypothetical protein
LIDRQQPHSVNVMFRNDRTWTLLYQDKVAQLWGRAAKYDDPGAPDYIPRALRRVTEAKQEGTVPWPGLPQSARTRDPGPDGTQNTLATNSPESCRHASIARN